MGQFLYHEPCPECHSKDNLARYDNGSATCFGCGHWEPETDEPKERRIEAKDFHPVRGEFRSLPSRGLAQDTLEFWNYQVAKLDDVPHHIANYRDATGQLVAQHLRDPDKKFPWRGDWKKAPLYGMWLWGRGKSITITEGELDALSVSQAFKNKWPVVSLPSGADSAEKALTLAYEYLDQFDKIVLMFDQDEPGQKAVEVACSVLPMGKVHVAVLPEKDANDVLVKRGPEVLVSAFWNAKPWRPDGIVSGEEFTLERLKTAAAAGHSLPAPKLQEMILGLRKGELTLLTAGSGIGKSSWARELAYHLHQVHGLSIGNVFLEENNTKTAQGYVALHNNVALGKLRHNPSLLTDQHWQDALTNVIHKRMWFYNHFGSLEAPNLLSKLRYFATVCKVDFIILDHISIVTSGVESSSEGERKDIDILMTRLRSLVEETGVGIIAIVHLKRAQNKTFSEGDQISLSDLRGSGSLEQLSDNVLGLERNQQDQENRDVSQIRVLKCRETGDTGEADQLIYNRSTGRLFVPELAAL